MARPISVRGLTEGAILAALVAVLALAANYVPLVGLAANFLCPIPLAVLMIRHGLRGAALWRLGFGPPPDGCERHDDAGFLRLLVSADPDAAAGGEFHQCLPQLRGRAARAPARGCQGAGAAADVDVGPAGRRPVGTPPAVTAGRHGGPAAGAAGRSGNEPDLPDLLRAVESGRAGRVGLNGEVPVSQVVSGDRDPAVQERPHRIA